MALIRHRGGQRQIVARRFMYRAPNPRKLCAGAGLGGAHKGAQFDCSIPPALLPSILIQAGPIKKLRQSPFNPGTAFGSVAEMSRILESVTKAPPGRRLEPTDNC